MVLQQHGCREAESLGYPLVAKQDIGMPFSLRDCCCAGRTVLEVLGDFKSVQLPLEWLLQVCLLLYCLLAWAGR